MLLKRASKNVEKSILLENKELAQELHVNLDNKKVYLQLNDDGSIRFNRNGNMAIAIYSDEELRKRILRGSEILLP